MRRPACHNVVVRSGGLECLYGEDNAAILTGLLCLSCNTALGQIERKTGLARAYLAAPPGRLLTAASRAKKPPLEPEGGLSFLVGGP